MSFVERPIILSFVERSIILCPYLGGSTIGGSTVYNNSLAHLLPRQTNATSSECEQSSTPIVL